MRIVYVIGKYITFPGAFLRAFWEQLTCLLLGIPVEHSGYLRANEMCGHIEHFLPEKSSAAYVQATAPGVMGLLTGLPMFMLGFVNLRFMGFTFGDSAAMFILYVAMTYVGASIMCCLHPQYEVAVNLWDITLSKFRSGKAKSVISGIFTFLPSLFVYIGAVLERFSVPVLVWAVSVILAFVI